MPTVTMTRCEGGEHVTLHVLDDDGKTTRQVPVRYSELMSVVAAKNKDEAVKEQVKKVIAEADAKDFQSMKAAVESTDFAVAEVGAEISVKGQ
jgi:hypothetical protein